MDLGDRLVPAGRGLRRGRAPGGGPSCSAYQAAANAAEKLGYKNIKHMSAGISGWLQAGEKTEKAN